MATSIALNRRILCVLLFSFLWNLFCAVLSCKHCAGESPFLCSENVQNQPTVKLVKYGRGSSHILSINCSETNFTLLEGCSFPTVSHVRFHFCYFTNESFIDIFDKIGVGAERVKSLFLNHTSHASSGLERYQLRGLSNLIGLYIQWTHLEKVSEHVFEETPNLKFLYLIRNKLKALSANTFHPITELASLRLSENSLSSLPRGIFDNLRKLRSLSLWQNEIISLHPGVFDHLGSLQNLSFQSNKLESLDGIFKYTPNLKIVNFQENALVRLNSNLFANCSKLRAVHFSGNAMSTLPENLFLNQLVLEEVSFDRNQLEFIPEGLFLGVPSLASVNLSSNAIKKLPEKLFSFSPKLKILDLSNNALETLPSQLFTSSINIEILDISSNNLGKLEDNLLSECHSLIELRCQDNQLASLSLITFPSGSDSSLQIIDFSQNKLTEESIISYFTFALNQQLNLEKIDFSYNQFSMFPSNAEFYNFLKLRYLNFEGNSISWISFYDIISLSFDIEVNLKHNLIERVITNDLEANNDVRINLEGNPFICDCDIFKFIESIQEDIARLIYYPPPMNGNIEISDLQQVPRAVQVMDSQKLVCENPANLKGKKLSSLDLYSLICPIPSNHCSDDCPCSFRPFDNMMIINCSGQQRTSLPYIQYHDSINYTIDLSHNQLSYFNFSSSKEKPVVNLNLKDNRLVSEALSDINLLPPRLEFLHLGENNLTHLKDEFIHQINVTGTRVDLGDNPWVCDCHIKDLHDFIQAHYTKVVNVHSITCASDGRPLVDLTEEDLCPASLHPIAIVIIGGVAALLVFFATLGTISFYRYNTRIKVWLFAHQTCLWFVTEDELDVDKMYDAFVSYSHKDEDFVNNHLVPGLEKGEPQYRVCLHYRDWVVGEFIQNQILDSVHNSRRTLVVLSTNFIESVWGQMEFRAAHQQALQDKTNRVIVIVYGEMPPEKALDGELLHYVKLHTYLKWDDPNFWDSLRYAMPHPKQCFTKKRSLQRHKSTIEKLELVNGHVVVNKDNAIPV